VTAVHFVVPDGIDDPARPSGGNVYDRRVSRGLSSMGWSVRECAVPGFWSEPGPAAFTALDRTLRGLPDHAVVLLDGLVASRAPEVLVPQAARLRLVVLVHMPLENDREGAVLSAAAATVTTSAWSRQRLTELYGLPAEYVHVAHPGVDRAELAPGTAGGGALLCVAAVIPGKGHDVLLEALSTITDLSWECVCVGSLERDPAFVDGLRSVDGRVTFTGPRTGAALDQCYAAADLVVSASRAETYGMVVAEALARGLPVIATNVGGVTEALGDGGLLVPPDDPAALADALRAWLGDAELRERLRHAARERRESLPTWAATAAAIADVLG
jgi:glycosyltransferase involved in cell wall biosynthesis